MRHGSFALCLPDTGLHTTEHAPHVQERKFSRASSRMNVDRTLHMEPIAIAVESKADYSHWIGMRLLRSGYPKEDCVLESSLPSPCRVIEPGLFSPIDH